MAFSSQNKFWAVSAAILIVINFLIQMNLLWPPPLNTAIKPALFSLENSFEKTVHNAYDAMKYLYLAQKNQASVAPVVEKSLLVVEALCYCAHCAPKITIVDEREHIDHNQFLYKKWIYNNNEVFHVFSAYLDARQNSLFPDLSVQILTMAFDFLPEDYSEPHYCHFILTNSNKISFSVEAKIRIIWQKGWDPRSSFYNAYLISCPVPKRHEKKFLDSYKSELSSVMVTSRKCPAYNSIYFSRLIYTPETLQAAVKADANKTQTRSKIGVCVKGMDFAMGEISQRKLAEWIELQYALGADSITIYVYHITPEIARVLRFYNKNNKLQVIRLELPGESPKIPMVRHNYIWRNRQQKRRHELIPYNDCFYRYSHSHDFVLIVDTDEIVVPLKKNSWSEMLIDFNRQHISKNTRMKLSAISVQNVFKFTGMEIEGSIFDDPSRSAIVQERGLYGKSFMNTKSVATVFNHFALHRLHANVFRTVYVDESIALKLHFKSGCPQELKEKCVKLQKHKIHDNSLERFKGKVSKNIDAFMANITNKF